MLAQLQQQLDAQTREHEFPNAGSGHGVNEDMPERGKNVGFHAP
jgi:hypothetical protein